MANKNLIASALLVLACLAEGRNVTANLKSLYNKASSMRCGKPLSGKFQDGYGKSGFVYCGDRDDIVYITGPSSNMPLANMDIDCDGANRTFGACANDKTGQNITAFKHKLGGYGIGDLNANKHTYVVLGNQGATPSWMPDTVGVEPLSVVAVVCNNKLFYGIWGDTNGGVLTGEASISLAQMCFSEMEISGNKGYTKHDVLYVAFMGKGAVPGAGGANWKANNSKTFEKSLEGLGNKLVAKII